MSTPTTPPPAGDEPAVLADWLRRIADDPELILASAERLKMRNAAAALERLERQADSWQGIACGKDVVIRSLELDLAAERARAERAEAALRDAVTPEWFCVADDPDICVGDPSELWANGDYGPDDVVKVIGCRQVCEEWAAEVVLTRDADGDPNDTVVRTFATEAEARAALLASQPED